MDTQSPAPANLRDLPSLLSSVDSYNLIGSGSEKPAVQAPLAMMVPASGNALRDKGLVALQLVASTMSSGLELEEVESICVRGICEILEAETGVLILIDEEDQALSLEGAYAPADACLKLEPEAASEVIRTGRAVRVDPGALAGQKPPDIVSLLCVPLIAKGEILGAIQLVNKCTGCFDDDDQEILSLFSGLLANSLNDSRTIRRLKVTNADLEANRWELIRSRNTLRTLFDSTPLSIYIVDQKFTLIAVNSIRAKIAGRQPNEIVGRACFEALYRRGEPCPGCRVSETLLSGQHTERIERRWEGSSDPQEFEIGTYPIYNDAQQVVQAFLFENDVTEKRRLESTLVQSEKLAAIGQLAAGITHEINNPLTAIIANAQLLQRRLTASDEETRDMLDLILYAGNRATKVVRNLLDFARKDQYEFSQIDLNETIRNAIALVQHQLVARSIDLDFGPDEDLPPIRASQDHLQGVWINLLLNALDAIDEEGGEVRVATRRVGNEVHIAVADNGKGIPPESITHIFEPFYTTKEPDQGTGLGLSICHRIVKQHGGHVVVDSQPSLGTEFTVILPIV